MKPTRVAHVVVAGELGGAEHMLRDLAQTPGDIDHVLCVLSKTPAVPRFFEAAGLRVHDGGRSREDVLATLGRAFGHRELDWLERSLRREEPAIVHLHTFASQVLGTRAAIRVGARIVRTEHSTRVYDDPSCWPFSRWSLARTDAVVAISAHVRDVALEKAPFVADRIRVVPNGVDTTKFVPEARPARAPHAPFRFILVGRLEPRKGVDIALRALTLVPSASLDVVGDGEDRALLEALSRDLGLSGRVTFHGYVQDPRTLLAEADAALASSRKEGLGIAFLEAMAMGLPLVTVPVGGLLEIVEHERTGVIARAATVEDLAAAMRTAAADRGRARHWGDAARSAVDERYSLAAMRAGYRAVYRTLT